MLNGTSYNLGISTNNINNFGVLEEYICQT